MCAIQGAQTPEEIVTEISQESRQPDCEALHECSLVGRGSERGLRPSACRAAFFSWARMSFARRILTAVKCDCYDKLFAAFSCLVERPRRLARPRTSPFHGGNTGSNPVGDAKSYQRLRGNRPVSRRHKKAQISPHFRLAPPESPMFSRVSSLFLQAQKGTAQDRAFSRRFHLRESDGLHHFAPCACEV
jgi:hypothetical protein